MAKYLDATGVSTLWSKVKEYGTTTASAAVKTITDTKGAKNGIASLDSNGYVPLSQLGNLDTTFAEVVTALPTSNIKKHLYLVKSSDTSQNLYSEYIYTGDTTATYNASKWEKLGEYKADVDLSGYAKKTEALGSLATAQDATKATIHKSTVSGSMSDVYINSATSSVAGVMSAADKAKLDGIAANANNYSLPTASASTLGGIKVGSNLSINNGVLSGTADTHYTSKNVVASTTNGTTNGSATGTVYLNHVETTGLTSSHAIKSGTNTLVSSDASGNITITASNTHVNTAAFTADTDKVTLTLTLNDGSKVTADIPEICNDEGHEATGVLTYAQYMYLAGAIKELLNVEPAEKGATADSAITAEELAKILV